MKPRNITKALVVVATCLGLLYGAAPAGAEDVGLDTTFSVDGRVFVGLPGDPYSDARALAVSGSSIYVSGVQELDGRVWGFVARLTSDGSYDVSFSDDGVVYLPERRLHVFGMTVDRLGRALVVAQSKDLTVVTRLTADGALDETFSADGRREFRGGAEVYTLDPAVAVDGLDRIVVATTVVRPSGSSVVIRRLTSGGVLDSTWAHDGVLTIGGGGRARFGALAVDERNRVLVATDNRRDSAAVVRRFRGSGTADWTFSDDGTARFQFQVGVNAMPLGLGVDDLGSITVVAASDRDGTRDDPKTFSDGTYGTVRYLADGTLDPSYGDNGILGLSCLNCTPVFGTVTDGKAAVSLTPWTYRGAEGRISGPTRVVRISGDGRTVEHRSTDIYPDIKEWIGPVAIDRSGTLVAGDAFARAFVARFR